MTPAPRERGAGGSQFRSFVVRSVVGATTDQALDLGDGENVASDVAYEAGKTGEPDGSDEGFDGCEQHLWLLMWVTRD